MPTCLYCLTPYVTQAEGRQEQACECGEMICVEDQREGYFDDDTVANSRRAQLAIDNAMAKVEEREQ